jgi:hypothetical protein
MPNRYEREIEEILRNLEQSEQKPGLGQRFSERLRRRPSSVVRTRQRKSFSLHFGIVEWLLIILVGTALLAGGYAYANRMADVFSGVLAAVGIVCLILIAASHFLFGPRRRSSVQSTRYSNISPLRRDPFSAFRAQWKLFLLKLRYRRKNDL